MRPHELQRTDHVSKPGGHFTCQQQRPDGTSRWYVPAAAPGRERRQVRGARASSRRDYGAAARGAAGAGPRLCPEWARSRCARIFRITTGSWSVAIRRSRPRAGPRHPRFPPPPFAIVSVIIASSRWAAACCPPLSARRRVATSAASSSPAIERPHDTRVPVLALPAHRFERQDGLHVAVHLATSRSRDHGHHRVLAFARAPTSRARWR